MSKAGFVKFVTTLSPCWLHNCRQSAERGLRTGGCAAETTYESIARSES